MTAGAAPFSAETAQPCTTAEGQQQFNSRVADTRGGGLRADRRCPEAERRPQGAWKRKESEGDSCPQKFAARRRGEGIRAHVVLQTVDG